MHELVDKLAAPGAQVERLASTLATNLDAAGKAISGAPLIGDDVTDPLTRAAGAARTIAEAGHQQQQWAHDAANTGPLLMLVVPLGLVVLWWLPRRLGRARRVAAVAGLRATDEGLDLLALRALATQPVARLARTYPDIAVRWRRGDADAITALATLELRRTGLNR